MPSLQDQMLEWVMLWPREEWAERWEAGVKALRRYDPARMPLGPFLGWCWKRRLIDISRRSRVPLMTNHPLPDYDLRAPDEREAPDIPPMAFLPDKFVMQARGVKLHQMALALGKPIGSVKSTMHHFRDRVRAA